MTGEPPEGYIRAIRQDIEEVRQDRVRRGLAGVPTEAEVGQRESGLKGRAGRLPVVGSLMRWAYGLVKAPARIRDLLTLIRLADMEAGRHRAEARAMGVKLDEAMAVLRTAQAASGDLAADLLTRTKNLEDRAADNEGVRAALEDRAVHLQALAGTSKQRIEDLEAVLADLAARLAAAEEGAAHREDRLGEVIDILGARKRAEQVARERQLKAASREQEAAGLYGDLEEQFRGGRALVRERQGIYLPIIKEIKVPSEGLPVVDVGCGRGEWLEVLKAADIPGRGVDWNPAQVAACQAAGLQVEEGPAESFLATLPAASVRGVTCFHLLEHMTFPDWFHLVREVWRVLAPGGVAIFESPNPENLLVAASDFYLDPTHVRPIPSRLLLFVAEQAGFDRCRIMELHPRETGTPPQGHGEDDPLQRHIQGPQDYAVLGWKPQPASS